MKLERLCVTARAAQTEWETTVSSKACRSVTPTLSKRSYSLWCSATWNTREGLTAPEKPSSLCILSPFSGMLSKFSSWNSLSWNMQIHENIWRVLSSFFIDLCSLNKQSRVNWWKSESWVPWVDILASTPQLLRAFGLLFMFLIQDHVCLANSNNDVCLWKVIPWIQAMLSKAVFIFLVYSGARNYMRCWLTLEF